MKTSIKRPSCCTLDSPPPSKIFKSDVKIRSYDFFAKYNKRFFWELKHYNASLSIYKKKFDKQSINVEDSDFWLKVNNMIRNDSNDVPAFKNFYIIQRSIKLNPQLVTNLQTSKDCIDIFSHLKPMQTYYTKLFFPLYNPSSSGHDSIVATLSSDIKFEIKKDVLSACFHGDFLTFLEIGTALRISSDRTTITFFNSNESVDNYKPSTPSSPLKIESLSPHIDISSENNRPPPFSLADSFDTVAKDLSLFRNPYQSSSSSSGNHTNPITTFKDQTTTCNSSSGSENQQSSVVVNPSISLSSLKFVDKSDIQISLAQFNYLLMKYSQLEKRVDELEKKRNNVFI